MRLVFITICPICEWRHQVDERPSDSAQFECACCGKAFAAEWEEEEQEEILPPPSEDIAPTEATAPTPNEASEPASAPSIPPQTATPTIQPTPAIQPTIAVPQTITNNPQPMRVVVTDFDMSFGSMVNFMVKWALAAIPAAIILLIIAFGLMAALAMLGKLSGAAQ